MRILRYFIFLVFGCIAVALLYHVYNLSLYVPFHDWDEAIYAHVAKEWTSHPGFTLTYNGSLWFEKPPIPFIIWGSLFSLFGAHAFVARLISAILGFSTFVLVYTIAHQISKDKLVSFAGATILFTSQYFIDRSSIVNVDIFLACAWLLYISSDRMWTRMVSILLGVGSKSLLGFFPLIVDVALHILNRSLTKKRIVEYGAQILVGISWYVYMSLSYGRPFYQSHFLDHLVSRITKPIELHFGDKFFYFETAFKDLHIFLILGCVGALTFGFQMFKHKRTQRKDPSSAPSHIGLMVFIIPITYMLLLTVSKAKLQWYIVPVIPFIALWVVYFFIYAKRWNSDITKIILLIVIAFGMGTFVINIMLGDFKQYPIPDKTRLGQCIDQKTNTNQQTIHYLVNPQERKDAQVIEAAKLQIGSSFIYGGAPAFLYYANRPINFIYSVTKLRQTLDSRSGILLAYHVDDKKLIDDLTMYAKKSVYCTSGTWSMVDLEY